MKGIGDLLLQQPGHRHGEVVLQVNAGGPAERSEPCHIRFEFRDCGGPVGNGTEVEARVERGSGNRGCELGRETLNGGAERGRLRVSDVV